MPLQNSGQISLDQIHVEAGGTTQTEASLNDADIRSMISQNANTNNQFSYYYGASLPTIEVNDRLVFTSCAMHGPMGPYAEMIPAFYGVFYNSDFTNQFQTMQYAGIQRWKFPTAGTYKFYLKGANAGHTIHNGWDTNNSNFHASNVRWTDGSGSTIYANYHSNQEDYGLGGLLTVSRTVAKDEILDIMIGQAGEGGTYNNLFHVCSSGGGATAIAFNSGATSGWDAAAANINYADVAVAGGGGSNRNENNGNVTNRNSTYSTTGQTGEGGSGGTAGYGGNDSYTGSWDGSSGAGYRGNGSEHGDERQSNSHIQVFDGRAQAIFTGNYKGQGSVSGSQYSQPWWYNGGYDTLYFSIDSGHKIIGGTSFPYHDAGGAGTIQQSGSSFAITMAQYETWAGTQSSSKTTFAQISAMITNNGSGGVGRLPGGGGFAGGFGGGGVGNWGGCAGGGGWSGGGAGRNSQYGGAGSSYNGSGFTYLAHDNVQNNENGNQPYLTGYATPANNVQITANSTWAGASNQGINAGCWRGNGWLVVERTS